MAGTLACSIGCPKSGVSVTLCNWVGLLFSLFDTINDVIGLVDQWKSISYDVCGQYEDDYF